jgi:glycosyltransferase involved in cell wall biosynthesis
MAPVNPHRLRIALFIESPPSSAGGFQQSVSTIHALASGKSPNHDLVVFTPFEETRAWLKSLGIDAVRYRCSGFRLIDRWSATVVGGALLRRLRRLGLPRVGRHLDAILDDHRIDLAFFNECGNGALRIGDHPLIVTVWDLDQRDYPEFPESYADRVFQRSDNWFRATLPRALAVVVNSPSIGERVASVYGVDRHRIVELPFLPSLAVREHAAGRGTATAAAVRDRYNLPDRYIFYPAHFTYHKNHLYLLQALVALERKHKTALHAVFCGGGYPHDQPRVERQATALGLRERVHFLGVVPDADIPPLYQGALALAIPSYFGPTNLPPLEAVVLGCPVICSDLPGCREQMRDAALYCNLDDPSDLADKLFALQQDTALRERLASAGSRRAKEIAEISYSERLAPLLDRFAYVSQRWKWCNEG